MVAARPEGAPRSVRALGPYLVPRHRADGQLNYFIRRIKYKSRLVLCPPEKLSFATARPGSRADGRTGAQTLSSNGWAGSRTDSATLAGAGPGFRALCPLLSRGRYLTRPAGVDLRIRSLITIAALDGSGGQQGLELNIRMALNNGATRDEIVETLLHLAPYIGFPGLLRCVNSCRPSSWPAQRSS